MRMNHVEVRGARTQIRPATIGARALAAFADFGLGLLLFGIYARHSSLAPLPLSRWTGALILALALPWALSRALFGKSAGESAWQLRPKVRSPSPFARRGLVQPIARGAGPTTAGILLTAAACGLGAWLVSEFVSGHPLFRALARESFPASLPVSSQTTEWSVLPFYYSLGSWPLRFESEPVLFSIPYEKGPPTKFFGRVNARWGESRLTIEGPKSPAAPIARDKLKACLISEAPLECVGLRSEALSRHIGEMSRVGGGARNWKLSWFAFENPALPEAERLEGIFIRATGRTAAQDRFVVITPTGGHQAFYLESPLDPAQSAATERAREALKTAVSSQRATGSLEPGKNWIDRELASVRLSPEASPDELARAEALLVSKLTVDPGVLEAYFHLSGAALLLLKAAAPISSDQSWIRRGMGAQRALILGLKRFARDVAPDGPPLVLKIEDHALEAQKY